MMNPLQEKQFEMLKVFIGICEKHNLQYFLVGGSTLGAVRHKGFIPWDDDIDVGMVRDEYDKFIKIAPKELEGTEFFLQTWRSDPHFTYPFAKIRNNKTTYVEDFFANHQINHGVWIDILPIDGLTDKNIPKEKCKPRLRRYIFHIYMAYLPALLRKFHKRTFFKDLFFGFVGLLFYPLNIAHFHQRRLDKMAHEYPLDKATLAGNHLYYFTGRVEGLPPKIYLETTDAEFEGIKVKIQKDYDTYLKCLYGDYMKLPPENQREGHHYNTGFSLDVGWEEYLYGKKKE